MLRMTTEPSYRTKYLHLVPTIVFFVIKNHTRSPSFDSEHDLNSSVLSKPNTIQCAVEDYIQFLHQELENTPRGKPAAMQTLNANSQPSMLHSPRRLPRYFQMSIRMIPSTL
jgi:hypothetical protein